MDKVVTHGNLSGAANGACTLIREALDIWGKYERQEPSYRAYHAGILKKLVRHHPGIFPGPLDSRGAPPSWDLGLVLGFGCPPPGQNRRKSQIWPNVRFSHPPAGPLPEIVVNSLRRMLRNWFQWRDYPGIRLDCRSRGDLLPRDHGQEVRREKSHSV